jgi:hypothetical protein
MTTYYDTVLLDANLNKISMIIFDYYTVDSYTTWYGYIFNDTSDNIDECKITTESTYAGMLYVTGGGVTGFSLVPSSWDTAPNLGVVISGGTTPIALRIFISGGSLSGLQNIPVYISK